MTDWQKYVLKMCENGSTWSDIAKRLNEIMPNEQFTKERVRSFVRRYRKNDNRANINREISTKVNSNYAESTEYKADGTLIQDKLITICEDTPITPDSILKAHGLDAECWQVISYKNNLWHGHDEDGKTVMYQSKIIAKPRENEISFKTIERYFAEHNFPAIKHPMQLDYDSSKEVLEIDLADVHSGLFSWSKETGDDYDLHIARKRFEYCISDIIDRCKHRTFKKIIIATLGDLLHFDNDKQETTKGTFQQADGRIAKVFTSTLNMLIVALGQLVQIAPVEFVYVPGNHDVNSAFMLATALKCAYMNNPNITFDISPNPLKAKVIGCNLIGLTHGNMPNKNMPYWLQQEFKKEFGASKFAEVHSGHIHTQKVGEFTNTVEGAGVIVRYLPRICSSSAWEHEMGYGDAVKTTMSFVWHEEKGLRETWFSNI